MHDVTEITDLLLSCSQFLNQQSKVSLRHNPVDSYYVVVVNASCLRGFYVSWNLQKVLEMLQ
jgi:hypothetical protein